MKKIFMAGCIMVGVANTAFAGYSTSIGKDCVYYMESDGSNGHCYWCYAVSSIAPSDCRAGYAMCTDAGTVLSVNASIGPYSCTSAGFCLTSCSGEQWYDTGNGYEIKQIASGCWCDSWTSTSETRCAAGYYESADSSNGCAKCPDFVNDLGTNYSATSTPGVNKVIDDCFLSASSADDKSGNFIFTEFCYYGDNRTTDVPEPVLPPPSLP